MARGDMLCPVCGGVLGLPNWQYRGGMPDAADTTSHVHMSFTATFTCSQGHRWRAVPDSTLILERVQ